MALIPVTIFGNPFTSSELAALIQFADLGDPNADRILGWDDTDNSYKYFVIGSGITYTHATHTLSVSAGGTGTVTSISIATANGFSGTSDGNAATPTLTIATSVTGILQGNGTAISAISSTGSNKVVLSTAPVFDTFTDYTGIASPSAPASGTSRLYSFLDGTTARLSVKTSSGLDLVVFRDGVQKVYNPTGSTITKGSAVYVVGENSGFPSVNNAKADSISTDEVFGVMISDALATGFGTAQFTGHAQNLNTNSFNLGDILYLSDSTAGALTATPPSVPSSVVPIGTVLVKDATVGEIFLEIVAPTHLSLNNLTDVDITSPVVDQFLRYNGSDWVNAPGASASAGPGVIFYNSTPIFVTGDPPGGISQDGTAGNGIKIRSLTKTPVTSLTSTVTISNATPAVVGWTSHGLPISAPIVFTTNGTLPSPLVAGTTYFIISAAYGANSFEISATVGGAAINTTTAGSGTFTATVGELTASGLSSTDTRAFAAWLYNTALGRTSIDAGVWQFFTYAGVSNTTGTNTITRKMYQVVPASSGTVTMSGGGANTRTATITSSQFTGTYFTPSATNTSASYIRTPIGIFQITASGTVNTATITVPTGYTNEVTVAFDIWNPLFSATTADISTVTPTYTLVTFSTTQPAYTIAATDKLGAISFFTTSAATHTVTVAYNGTTHNTRFETPLSTLHNELAGLQGGTSNEFYHLTAAEYTATGTTGSGNFARLTSPQFTTPNIGTATGSVSGNSGSTTLTAITDDTTTNADMFPTWVTTASSNQAVTVSSSKLKFHPSTGAFTATNFVGTFAGNTITAGTAILTGSASKTLTWSDSTTLATNAITLGGGEVITFSASNALSLLTSGSTSMTFPAVTDTVAVLGTAQTYTATMTEKQVIWTNNAITASGNAATVPITHRLQTVTNNSAATLTITITTTSAVDGQLVMIRVLPSSAAAQTITWVNTENSTVTAPILTNATTTSPVTVGFQYNGGSSLWRCIASA